MACEFEIVLLGDSEEHLRQVAELALEEIGRLDHQLSYFDRTSDVSFLNAEAWTRPIPVEPGLFGLLKLAQELWLETDGAFDVTSAPLVDLWREAERTGSEPSAGAICSALASVGMNHVVLDDLINSVRLDGDGVRISLGAIGKGYAVDCVAGILREYEVESALVSAGRSSIRAFGNQPGGPGWTVGIRHPSNPDEHVTTVCLRDQAMATSGGVMQKDEAVEERFEHIIDPRTGQAAESGLASVSVVAESGALADALSTAFYLGGKSFAEARCQDRAGVCAILVEPDNVGCGFSVMRVSANTGGIVP